MDRLPEEQIDYERAVRECVERGFRVAADVDERWAGNPTMVRAEIEALINDTVALLPRTEIFQTLVVLSKSRLTLRQPRQAVDTILRAARKHASVAPRPRRH
jgi:hypothetical protein